MSNNIPISQFVSDNISLNDVITFVRNNQNYKTTVADLITAIGAIGSLESIGDDLAIPVLEQPTPTTNQIRKILGGAGVEVSTSPNNGIEVKADLLQGDISGVQVLANPEVAPLVKSIRAQSGSSVTVTDGGSFIQIGVSETPVTNRTVVVNSIDDFPTPVDGVIELEDRVDYFLGNDITTSNRFTINGNAVIRSGASQINTLSYTGSETMFTGVNPSFRIDRVTVNCPNGTLFNMSSNISAAIFQMIESNVESCQNAGTLDGAFIARFKAVAWENIINNGIVCTGLNSNLVFETNIVFLNGGTFLDFNDAVYTTVNINSVVVQTSAMGTTFISGAPNSANILTGGFGTVVNCRVFGDATPLSGITSKDVRWEFSLNDGIQNTRQVALSSLSGNALATTISAINTPVKSNGVWVCQDESYFTCDSTGRITYVGEKNAIESITTSFSMLADSGGDKQASALIAVNGVVIPETAVQVTINSSKAGAGTCIWEREFTNGDYIELFVENNQDTTDIIVNGVQRVD